ncbi:DUF948 domain-containing protein [Nanchangia anserum]|uniref:DUF948 domain-containing protein n=1 Tax=Nanchangia anserum TaxID=2692125 RepID=A0A8I0G7W1_9ACTO|nr:DUF948 domain-containing protein [Nanchangia anserum]MBD3688769.1 DUF948 domain-containing protein [Nanchangia anserum]QOX82507.1 DUF948 domain-containing protein [Nanchangia anserum]
MSVGSIAALIAALAFVVLVAITAVPLLKLGKVFDQLSASIREVATNANGTIVEANQVVRDANAQLSRVDAVTTSAAQVSQDISALSALVSATLGGPLIKLAAFTHATRSLLRPDDRSGEQR